ncbi:MAG: acetyl-CoA carboxylase biotin carboxyl carrier protein [Pseudomonadota bacterium]
MSDSTAKPASKRAGRASEEAALRARTEADIAFIEALSRVLRENDLAEIEVSREFADHQLDVRLSRVSSIAPAPLAAPAVLSAPAPMLSAPAMDGPGEKSGGAEPSGDAVTAPMVGTVYLSPEPDADAYVSVGDRVEEGQTLLIIEAMKTMNHIPSPRAGVVREILVANAQPVEYGAPLLVVS